MWFLLLLALLGLLIYGIYVSDASLGTLRHLLRSQQWREACEETEKLLWLITVRNVKGELLVRKNSLLDGILKSFPYTGEISSEEIQSFPCDKLQAIDRLWKEYSDGYFGLSVQASIYKSISLNPSEREEIKYLGRGLDWMSVEQFKAWEDLGWSYRNYYESISKKNDCQYSFKKGDELNFSRHNVPRGHLPIFFNHQGAYPTDMMVDWWKRILSCNSRVS